MILCMYIHICTMHIRINTKPYVNIYIYIWYLYNCIHHIKYIFFLKIYNMYLKSCRFDLKEKFSSKNRCRATLDLRPWRWMDFVPSWPTWPWRHAFITRSADMASLKRFEAHILFIHFVFGRLVKDVFEQSGLSYVQHLQEWMYSTSLNGC